MENSKEIKTFIRKNRELFWHISDSKVEDISLDVLVEYIINYGDYDSVKELFNLLGTDTVATIFRKNTQSSRNNYNKLNRHFFEIYFNRHAHGNTQSQSKGITTVN
ncbi:MAG TPA: hypothetical protein PLP27_11380 [Crocinitomicaceae bacterium]|nr:hypothetical protein [Crocinitomicaceae bacterium]